MTRRRALIARWAAVALFTVALVMPTGPVRAQQALVVYSANDSTLNSLVFAAFEKETGTPVQAVTTGSGVLVRRIESEKDHPLGDIIWGVSRSILQANKAYFAPYRSKNRDAVPAEYRDPDDLWIGTNLHLLVILQNTQMVPEAAGPKSWADLLDEKWRGKIAFTDPANSGAAFTNVTLMADLWGPGDAGWQKVETFLRNSKLLNRSTLVFQGVGNGEYPVGVSLEYAGYLWASNGAPVKVIYPSDGTYAQMEGVAIIKGGPNSKAAEQFVDFINRKDVREMILAHTFRRPARQDLDLEKLPGGMPALSRVKQFAYDEDKWTKVRSETLDKIKDIAVRTR
jgi:iron(III) transport system substrate-binding protein